jgi:hydrogenase nickel incorporation protein HypA/HybF
MHEWALAEAVVKAVEELVAESGRVECVEVVFGELQSLDEEVFRFALEELLSSLREGRTLQ